MDKTNAKEVKQFLIDILENMLAHGPKYTHAGLCEEFNVHMPFSDCEREPQYSAILDWLDKKMTEWPFSTNQPFYPVPKDFEDDTQYDYIEAYKLFVESKKWVGVQRELRMDLIEFLIEELEDL